MRAVAVTAATGHAMVSHRTQKHSNERNRLSNVQRPASMMRLDSDEDLRYSSVSSGVYLGTAYYILLRLVHDMKIESGKLIVAVRYRAPARRAGHLGVGHAAGASAGARAWRTHDLASTPSARGIAGYAPVKAGNGAAGPIGAGGSSGVAQAAYRQRW